MASGEESLAVFRWRFLRNAFRRPSDSGEISRDRSMRDLSVRFVAAGLLAPGRGSRADGGCFSKVVKPGISFWIFLSFLSRAGSMVRASRFFLAGAS